MKIRKGTGVLAKDNKTPWAPRTLHYTSRSGEALWHSPVDYTMTNMALLIAMLHRGEIESVELIDEGNHKYVYELRAAEKRALAKCDQCGAAGFDSKKGCLACGSGDFGPKQSR
jgi:hypothetical protein